MISGSTGEADCDQSWGFQRADEKELSFQTLLVTEPFVDVGGKKLWNEDTLCSQFWIELWDEKLSYLC